MRHTRSALSFLLMIPMLAACASSSAGVSQTPDPEKGDKEETSQAAKLDSAFTKAVKSSTSYEGLFTVYQDTVTGKTHLAIRPEQLDKEFIYFTYTENGVVVAGQFRGRFRDNKVFTIRRRFERIELVTLNDNFYFDPDNALARAETANISQAVMASQKIVGVQDSTGVILIESDGLFLTETLARVKPISPPGARPGTRFTLGNLSKDKTHIRAVRNYPLNTDIVVDYVYDNSSPVNGGGPDVTDPRYVTITVQHSLIEMPENGFQPRFDDPRVGYFTQQVTDLTSTSATPYRDLVNRWQLVKKNPDAALSEPVEPITFWIENTTPRHIRGIVKDGVLQWNRAFEKAGFKNAVQVKIQPDDAEWDAGDIRYNVLRWTSSPRPPFGGYGPSFVNPRTGQILGADIMLEYSFLTRRLNFESVFSSAALESPVSELLGEDEYCVLGNHLQMSNLFGLTTNRVLGVDEVENSELLTDATYFLMLHEVGHTLGLNHNMKSSQMLAPEKINDVKFTRENGLTGSVMDYPAVNVVGDKRRQGQYYTTVPGPYDIWAIQYGYSPGDSNPKKEARRLSDIASRSTEPALAFGNDADDMR